MEDDMIIDLYYFNGCPSWQIARDNLVAAINAEAVEAEIRLTEVRNWDHAVRLKFKGSPSFIVQGHDLWAEANDTVQMSCRVYVTPKGLMGVPTVEMLREKINALKS